MLLLVFVVGATVSAYANDLGLYSAQSDSRAANDDLNSFDILTLQEDEEQSYFNVEATNITERTATLCWESKNVYLSYKVCSFNPITKSYDEYTTVTNTELHLASLLPDTYYRYCIMNSSTDEILGTVSFKTKALVPGISVANAAYNQVELNITDVSDGVTAEIYRGRTKSVMKKIGKIVGEGTYIDKDVKEGRTYYYKVKTVKNSKKIVTKRKQSNTIKVSLPKKMGLPSVSGETKTYAYYTAVTAKKSPQYKLLNSDECYTDEETGIRMYDGCYCIALGSYYGSEIGTKYRITLSNGKSFMAILCDQKSNRHTDKKHQYAVKNKDIIEFYVEKGKIPSGVNGNYGRLEQFSGRVVLIEKFV